MVNLTNEISIRTNYIEINVRTNYIEQDKAPLVTGKDGRVPVVMAKAASMSLRDRRAVKLSEVSQA